MKVAKRKRYPFQRRNSDQNAFSLLATGNFVDFPEVWQGQSGEEAYEMTSRVHSTHPIVVSIGVLSRSAA